MNCRNVFFPESPVVVFPRNEASLEVLMAHLGRISLTNQRLRGWDLMAAAESTAHHAIPADATEVDRYSITISRVNLNSLNILHKLEPKSARTLEGSFFSPSN